LKKTILYIIIAILYFLTPAFILGALGAMVSKKYEVDQSYWQIDGNEKLSYTEKRKQIEELDNRGTLLDYQTYAFTFVALTTFIVATGLIIKRNKILIDKKSNS